MKNIINTFALVLLASCTWAQNITGNWYGILHAPGKDIHIIFHISKTGDSYQTTMDSPDQGANGLPTNATIVTGNQLAIDASGIGIGYTGTYVPDSNIINGVISKGGGSLPLSLTSAKPAASKVSTTARPQDPTSFPYKREEVSFTNSKAGNTLAGTLTMPDHGKVSKIVVLITGSGPQNRDEEIVQLNHRPFLVWSDWLTRNGIAVLRFDDRGIGASTGNYMNGTTADFADDAEAAVNYIRSRADLKDLSIGLMGHSEGGQIAPMVASRNDAVKFIVLLAGPGLPISQLMLKQTADEMRVSGAPDSVIATSVAMSEKIYQVIKANKDLPTDQLNSKLETLMQGQLKDLNQPAAVSADDMRQTIIKCTSPWFRYFISFDPTPYLTHTKCPVLALNGTLDKQVSVDNLAAIKRDLEKGGNNRVDTVRLEGFNHMFQKATTGSVEEYAQISETVDPVAMTTVSNWINKL